MSLVGRRCPVPPRRTSAILAAIVVAVSAATALAGETTERLLDAWASSARAAGRTVEWGGLSRSTGEDRVELRDLTITVPTEGGVPIRITVPSVTIADLSERPGGGFALRGLDLPRLTMSTTQGDETIALELADVALADVAIPTFDRPSIDPDRPITSSLAATRVYDAVAVGRATIGRFGFSSRRADGSEHTEATAETVALTGLAGGRIERLAFARATLDAIAAVGRARLTVADTELLGFDPTVWRRVFDDGGAEGAERDAALLTSMDGLRTGPVALETGDAVLSLQAMRIGARRIGRGPAPLGRLIDRFLVGSPDASRGDAARVLLELFLATRDEGWTIEGFHLTGPDLDHADVARIAVGAFSGERLDELTVEGVDIVAPKAILRLARMTARDLAFPDGDDLRRALEAGAVGAEIDPSSLMPRLGHFDVERFEVAEPGVPAIRLGALVIDLDRFRRAVPTTVSAKLDHFVVPTGLADAEGRRVLGDLGYAELDISAALRLAWNETAKEIAVDTADLAIADMGRIEVKARLAGIPASLFLHPETIPDALPGIGLVEASATCVDASFVGRLIRKLARDDRTTTEKVRRRLAKEMSALFAEVRDPTRRRRMVEEARRFLDRTTSITLEVRPPAPVPIVEILETSDDLARLAERLDARLRTE